MNTEGQSAKELTQHYCILHSTIAFCNASASGGTWVCEKESFFCHGQSKFQGFMVNRQAPQMMKLTHRKTRRNIILIWK